MKLRKNRSYKTETGKKCFVCASNVCGKWRGQDRWCTFRGSGVLLASWRSVPSALFQCTLANVEKGKSTLWHHCQQQTVAAWRVDCRPAVKAGSGVLSCPYLAPVIFYCVRFYSYSSSVSLGVGVLVTQFCSALRFLMAEKLLMIHSQCSPRGWRLRWNR